MNLDTKHWLWENALHKVASCDKLLRLLAFLSFLWKVVGVHIVRTGHW
jgi:hypothetical protein